MFLKKSFNRAFYILFSGVQPDLAGAQVGDPESRLLCADREHPVADQAALPARVRLPRHPAPAHLHERVGTGQL